VRRANLHRGIRGISHRTSSLELKKAREFLNKARETVTRIGGKNFLTWDTKVRSSGRVLQLSGTLRGTLGNLQAFREEDPKSSGNPRE